MSTRRVSKETVEAMVWFQRTGEGFDGVWVDIAPVIDEAVRSGLRKHLVMGPERQDDEAAVADVTQEVAFKLLRLGGKQRDGKKVGYDPSHGHGGVSGFKGWLTTIARNECASYCRLYRGSRGGAKSIPLSQLELNGSLDSAAVIKPSVLKCHVELAELQDIVNDCVDSLPDELRGIVRLKMAENLSVRDIEKRLGIHVSTVQRRLTKAKELLTTALAKRGVDASCVQDLAA